MLLQASSLNLIFCQGLSLVPEATIQSMRANSLAKISQPFCPLSKFRTVLSPTSLTELTGR